MNTRLLLLVALWAFMSLCGAMAASEYPENEQPMYGGSQLPADKPMVYASEQAASLGWRNLGRGDEATAMKRFNQAWSLNPENAEALWGMASIMLERSKREAPAENLAQAVDLMRRAQVLDPKNSRLLGDFANVLAAQATYLGTQRQDGSALYAEAGKYFAESLEQEPDYPPTLANYAVFKFHVGDYEAAREYAEKAAALGYPISAAFKRKLAEQR